MPAAVVAAAVLAKLLTREKSLLGVREFAHAGFRKMGKETDAGGVRSLRSVAHMATVAVLSGIGLDCAVRREHAAHVDQGRAQKESAPIAAGTSSWPMSASGAQHLRGATAGRPHLGPARLLHRRIGTNVVWHLRYASRAARYDSG